MKAWRVTKAGKKPMSSHGVLEDDTVATAAVKLELACGSRVYMWCHRPVDAHEALAICVAGGAHVAGSGAYDPALAARELSVRFGVKATASQAATPLKMLRFLQKVPKGGLLEPVAMRNREVVPGGYFSSGRVDPYRDLSADPGYAEGHARPYNTGDLLIESFGAGEFFLTTEKDLLEARPQEITLREWRAGFVDRYVPPAVEDRDLFKWSEGAERRLREQRKTASGAPPPIVTYVPITGGTPVGTVGMDRILNAFASVAATEKRPVVRMQGGGVDRPVSRVHDGFPDAELSGLKAPAKREWIQAVFRGGKGRGIATVFPSGSYKIQLRFGYLERATEDDAVAYLGGINEFLEKVSPMIRPVSRGHLRPSSSLYIQKPQMLDTPSILGGPRNGIYQTVTIPLPGKCSIEDVARAVADRGYPSLKHVNTRGGEIHMHWVRTGALRKASVVKNIVHHNAKNGGLPAARAKELMTELGLTKREIAEIVASKFDRYSVMTLVRARLSSDTALTVQVNGNDPAYGERVAGALVHILGGCGKGKPGRAPLAGWSRSVSASPVAAENGVSPAGDLDEFYEFFDDDDDVDVDVDGDIEQAPPARGERQNGDILERLKHADPEVFAFPGQPGYVPYSMKCQKNSGSTRQPLVLGREEAERAAAASSSEGKAAFDNRLEYRGLTYVCPEKWCPVSGVARGLSEPCPDPDEPEWTMWSSNYPAFQPGVSHPRGLCMPCCFGSKPKKGLKTWNDIRKCKENAGEALEGDVEDSLPSKMKTGHVNKSDKLLDEGGYGWAPDDLFPVKIPGPRPVRRGMGPRERATLGKSLAYLLGYGSERALRAALSEALGPEHFIQGDVREFMTDRDAIAVAGVSKPEVQGWLTRGYKEALGIRSSLTAEQVVREARVMLAHRECARRLASGGNVSDTSLFRFANSGALDGRPVMLLETDEAGNAYAEHVPSRAMPATGKVAAVLKKRGTHEPVGFKTGRGFDPWWDAAGGWMQSIFSAVRSAVPEGGDRVVSRSMMAVGVVTGSGYLPFSRPVFVDPAYKHSHISDRGLPGPASERDAQGALGVTGDNFYRVAWRDVAETAQRDDEKDASLFLPSGEDRRAAVMAGVAAKAEAARRVTAHLSDHVDAAAFLPVPGETARGRIARLRGVAKKHLDPGEPDDVVDFAIESLLRPVPSGAVPSVKLVAGERIVHF